MKKMFSGEGGLQERGSSWTGLTSRTLQRRGSSGYMTASVASSNIAQSKQVSLRLKLLSVQKLRSLTS